MSDAVFYQIFPDRFARSGRVVQPGPLEPWDAPPTYHGFKGGDLYGIAEHLDELVELGVNALYLNPVFASASNHRYHTYDYDHVDPLLGGDEALRELLDEAHRRNVRVILDGVFNHASRGFWPFSHVLENGAQSPYRDWFYLDPEVVAGRRQLVPYPGPEEVEAIRRLQAAGSGNGLASERVLGYRSWWDLPALPKLNQDNAAMREYTFCAVEHWMRFGIDGWRLDVPPEIAVPGFWEEFRRRVRAANPEAYIVGEIWSPAPEWLTGDRFDALMNYPLAKAVLSYAGAPRLDMGLVNQAFEYSKSVRPIDGPAFARELETVMSLYPPEVAEVQLNLLDSHDTPRFISLAGDDAGALRLATLVQMTVPGAPCIYYGNEVGLGGRADPDCRRAYPWAPERQDRELRAFVAGLAAWRHAEPLLRHGRFAVVGAAGDAAAYALLGDDRCVVVALNAGEEPAELDVRLPDMAGWAFEQVKWSGCEWRSAFAPRILQGETLRVELAAREGVAVSGSPVA